MVLEGGDLVLADRVADELRELLAGLERSQGGRRDVEILALRFEERERELPEVVGGHTCDLCERAIQFHVHFISASAQYVYQSKVQYAVCSVSLRSGTLLGMGTRRHVGEGTYSETGLVHEGRAGVPGLDLVPEDDLDLPIVLAARGEEGPEHAIDSERQLRGERADVVH